MLFLSPSESAVTLTDLQAPGPRPHGSEKDISPGGSTAVKSPLSIDTGVPRSQPASHLSKAGATSMPQCGHGERKKESWAKTALRTFSPSWFAVIKGTGTIPIVLHALPYQADWLKIVSAVIFCLNTVIFLLSIACMAIRFSLFPGQLRETLAHPTQSLFLAAIPMALSTEIQAWIILCVPRWGPAAMWAGWGLWWVNVLLAVACALLLPFLMMHVHPPSSLSSMTAVWLLPLAAPVVASATGGVVAASLTDPHLQVMTVVACYVVWGIAMPLAFAVLGIYFQRLATHNLPPREVIVSALIPLGPLGSGSFAIMQLGVVAMNAFPLTNTLHPLAGDVLYILGFVGGLVMWGFILVWVVFGLASLAHYRFPFNMNWWGTIFPIGISAVATMKLGKELSSGFFDILGTIFGVALILIWLFTTAMTIWRASRGQLNLAPDGSEVEGLLKWSENSGQV